MKPRAVNGGGGELPPSIPMGAEVVGAKISAVVSPRVGVMIVPREKTFDRDGKTYVMLDDGQNQEAEKGTFIVVGEKAPDELLDVVIVLQGTYVRNTVVTSDGRLHGAAVSLGELARIPLVEFRQRATAALVNG